MDKETVVVKSEPDMFVVVKEETVDLTEESGYESLIPFDSESQIDDAEKITRMMVWKPLMSRAA